MQGYLSHNLHLNQLLMGNVETHCGLQSCCKCYAALASQHCRIAKQSNIMKCSCFSIRCLTGRPNLQQQDCHIESRLTPQSIALSPQSVHCPGCAAAAAFPYNSSYVGFNTIQRVNPTATTSRKLSQNQYLRVCMVHVVLQMALASLSLARG